MSPTRTVLYIDTSPKVGGGQVSLLALLERLDRLRYRPLLATPPGSGVENLAARIDIETIPIGIASRTARRTGMRAGRFRGWHEEPARLLRASLDIRRCIRDRSISLVHANNTLAGVVAALAARPGRLPVVFHHRIASPLHGVSRLAVDGASCVICVSDAVRASLGRMPEGSVVIPDGVDVAAFDLAREAEPATGGADRELRVVVLGRLSPEKGQDLFLEAAREVAARVPAAHFIIAGEAFLPGDTGFEAALHVLADCPALAGRVTFTGFHADVPALLAGADLVCVPSRREGLGIAAIEAMAARVPVVATAVGGLCESVVDGETGRLTPPAEPAALARAMIELLGDPALCRRMGEAGRRRVAAHFTRDIMTREITRTYDRLLGA